MAESLVSEAELTSSLISDIYDAALDAAKWPDVLERLCGYVSAASSMIFWQDSDLKIAFRQYSWGDDPHFTKLYFDKYVPLNPFITLPHFTDVGEVKSVRDLVPWDEIIQTRFYQEWMRPQDYVDNVFASLEKTTTSYAAFAVARNNDQGPANAEVLRRLRLLTPHIRRSVLIGKIIDLHRIDADTLAAAMDGLAAAIFLVDAAAKIVSGNSAARAMLDQGDVLKATGDTLSTGDPDAQMLLRDTISAAAKESSVPAKEAAVMITSGDGVDYVAHILPLTSGSRLDAGVRFSASAAVFVRKASLSIPSPPELLAKRYKLTPSELRVLLAIMDSAGVREVAEALGIAEATAKVHLHRLFQKTGTRRQADLVKIVAGFSSPLAT